jgi:hypothetical protein
MGTYLPWGIALFHASNSRFLHVAKRQRKYADRSGRLLDCTPNSDREVGVASRFRRLPYTTRTLILTSIAILLQVRGSRPFPVSSDDSANQSLAIPHGLDVDTLPRAGHNPRG